MSKIKNFCLGLFFCAVTSNKNSDSVSTKICVGAQNEVEPDI